MPFRNKKEPTNFSIDCILSSNEKSLKSPEITRTVLQPPAKLNKVLENPWISRNPFTFVPGTIRHQTLSSPLLVPSTSPIFYPDQKFLNFYPSPNPAFRHSPGFARTEKQFGNYLNLTTSTTPTLSDTVIGQHPHDLSPVYETLKIKCDKIKNESSSEHHEENYASDDEIHEEFPQDFKKPNFSSSFKCSECFKVFDGLVALQVHEKTHLKQKYECDDCGKKFSQLRNFKYHVSIHRGTKEFAADCPVCGKTFNDKGYLSSHLKIHRNRKEYLCTFCPKSFNQRVAYNMHVRIHTGLKPHTCGECGKQFSRKMLLKQHFRTHSGEKPYTCTECLKSFADRSNMILHYRLHSGVKPFSCHLCPKAFTKKHHLKTHLNYHTGNKPYKCPHNSCGQTFTQSSNMRTHSKKCQFKPASTSG